MKNIYWTSTGIIAIFLIWSAFTYLFQQNTINGVRELGFPDFFRVQLAVLKIIAVVILLFPVIPVYVKDWAYAGVALFLLTALVAHIVHRDSIGISIFLVILFGILIVSRWYLRSG